MYSYLGPLAPIFSYVDNLFRVSDRKTTFRTEFIGMLFVKSFVIHGHSYVVQML